MSLMATLIDSCSVESRLAKVQGGVVGVGMWQLKT